MTDWYGAAEKPRPFKTRLVDTLVLLFSTQSCRP